eukprot:3566893-Prymnesium_polylepis.2
MVSGILSTSSAALGATARRASGSDSHSSRRNPATSMSPCSARSSSARSGRLDGTSSSGVSAASMRLRASERRLCWTVAAADGSSGGRVR